jgi:hypothetical protein
VGRGKYFFLTFGFKDDLFERQGFETERHLGAGEYRLKMMFRE